MAASAGPEIERLIALLAKLPGLGPRSARRAALALLKRRDQLLDPLTADGAEDLADLILAAHADAKRQLDATQESIMREAMGPLAGLKLPGM